MKIFKKCRMILPFLILLIGVNVSAEEWAPDIVKGQTFPKIDAQDQLGKHWDNQSLLSEGGNGFLILFNRSIVW
ncbi:MAG: hypothetical protein ACI9FB_001612 [Candidatus Azotimanducaceae bacterium]|jgi:hypothetical protein